MIQHRLSMSVDAAAGAARAVHATFEAASGY